MIGTRDRWNKGREILKPRPKDGGIDGRSGGISGIIPGGTNGLGGTICREDTEV